MVAENLIVNGSLTYKGNTYFEGAPCRVCNRKYSQHSSEIFKKSLLSVGRHKKGIYLYSI